MCDVCEKLAFSSTVVQVVASGAAKSPAMLIAVMIRKTPVCILTKAKHRHGFKDGHSSEALPLSLQISSRKSDICFLHNGFLSFCGAVFRMSFMVTHFCNALLRGLPKKTNRGWVCLQVHASAAAKSPLTTGAETTVVSVCAGVYVYAEAGPK